jgi:endonuclease/exonuclease/phosphatase family metal-dependent hydrolase
MARLKIATFNALHGQGPFGEPAAPDLLRTAAAILDADIIGLQELDRHQLRSGCTDQVALIAQALNAPYHRFVPALYGIHDPYIKAPSGPPITDEEQEKAETPAYGIGFISRLPVLAWQIRRFAPAPLRMPLRVPGRYGLTRVTDEPRLAVAAVVDGPAGPLTVINTHLSFVPGWNATQLRRISRWAATLPAPRLLIGDFNLPGNLPRAITGWQQLARAATYPSYRPRVQFDHVLAQGHDELRVHQATALRLPVSDHCALTVDLEW